ncbi:hypothetical protein IAR50_006322 [Cryptococcus sp. DSM 104548]
MSQSSQSQDEGESLQQPSFHIRPCVPISKQLSNHTLDPVPEIPPEPLEEPLPGSEDQGNQMRESLTASIKTSTFSETQESVIDWTQKPKPLDESLDSALPLPPVAEETIMEEETITLTTAVDFQPREQAGAGAATEANVLSNAEPAKETSNTQDGIADWSALDITVRPQSPKPTAPLPEVPMPVPAPAPEAPVRISHPVLGSPEHDPDLSFDKPQGDATETDESPNVPTPEPSQPVASPRRLRGAVSAPVGATTPHQTMSPVSKYSSVKSKTGGGSSGLGAKSKAVHSAPGSGKGQSSSKRSARKAKEPEPPTPQKDSFEDDSAPKKDNPHTYLRTFFSTNSEQRDETGADNGSKSTEEQITANVENGKQDGDEGSGAEKDEDGEDKIEWGNSMASNRPRASTADYDNAPGSPTPTRDPSSGHDQADSPLQAGPSSGTRPRTNHPPSSPSTHEPSSREPMPTSSPPHPTGRFGFANGHSSFNESQSQPVVEDDHLFSSQVVSQEMDLEGEDHDFSQRSAAFPATQIQAASVAEGSSDPRPSSQGNGDVFVPTLQTNESDSYEEPQLEATLTNAPDQPETQVDSVPTAPYPPQRTITVPLHRMLQYNSRRNTASAPSPVTSEKTIELPKSRLLQRRKKNDGSGALPAQATEDLPSPKSPIPALVDRDTEASAERQQLPVNELQMPTPTTKNVELSPNGASQAAVLAPEPEAEEPTRVEGGGEPMDVDEPTVSDPAEHPATSAIPREAVVHKAPVTPSQSSSPDPLDQLHKAPKSKSKGIDPAIDHFPLRDSASLHINHDPSGQINVSFSTQRAPAKATPKAYKRRNRKAPKIFSPSEPSFERDAGEKDQGDSDNSSAPEDTEDYSYRPNVRELEAAKKSARRSIGGLSATSGAGPSRLGRVSEAGDPESESDTVQARPAKRRRATPRSGSSSPLSDEESSSAPEDPDDETFQVSGKRKAKGKRREASVASDTKRNRGTKGKRVAGKGKGKVVPDLERVKGGRTIGGGKSSTGSSTASTPTSTPRAPVDDTRVLAYYSRSYYPARILGITPKGYRVLYDDGDEKKDIPATKLRRLVLRKGDELFPHPLKSKGLSARMEVVADWDGDERGVKVKGFDDDDDEDGQYLGFVELKLVRILAPSVEEHFRDRLYLPKTPNVDTPSKAVRHPSPKKNTRHKIFTGLAFIFTTGTEDGNEGRNAVELKELVEMHGGVVYKSWELLFDKNVTTRFTSPYVPFVVTSGTKPVMTPKIMVALAKGIPILSDKFLDDSISQLSLARWQPYLMATPRSTYTGSRMSQVVDRKWGADEWDKDNAVHIEKPFEGLKILYIISDKEELDNLVMTCLVCLGTAEVQKTKLPRAKDASKALDLMTDPKWDYIVLEDRSVRIPAYLVGNEKMTSITWLKQCIIMGSALPPALDQGIEEEAKENQEEPGRKKKDEGKKGGAARKREKEKAPPKKRQKRR